MKKVNFALMSLFIASVFVLSGCAESLQFVSLTPSIPQILPKGIFSESINEKVSVATFTTGVDTKEAIFAQIGKPSFVADLKQNREVLAYLGNFRNIKTYYFFALRDGVFQESQKYYYTDVEKDRKQGILESELLKVFLCYRYTPTPTISPPTQPVSSPPPPTSPSTLIPRSSFTR
ncbi:MAG: hypothetical protein V1670_02090 [Candidatus Omnitrophota bacterium]